MTPVVRSRGGVVVLGLLLATVVAACASDDPGPKPAQARPTGPTETAPSPTTGSTGAEPAEPVERRLIAEAAHMSTVRSKES